METVDVDGCLGWTSFWEIVKELLVLMGRDQVTLEEPEVSTCPGAQVPRWALRVALSRETSSFIKS